MSEMMGVTRVESSAGVALDSAADVLVISPVKPVLLNRIGVIQDGGTDPGTGFVMAVDKRPTAGTDSDVNSRGARSELYNMSPDAAIGQGNGVYHDADDRYEIVPGEELVLEVTTGGAAGATGNVFAELVEKPFSGVDALTNMTDLT